MALGRFVSLYYDPMNTSASPIAMNTTIRFILTAFFSCMGFHASAGLFSLEIVEPATGVGDIGTLQILYDGEEENLSFAVGGLDLKLTSSTAGVIKFLDAEVKNDDGRWDIALARDIADNEIGDLFTASLFTPGMTPGGPQIFAEVKYRLVGSGFTDLLLDVGGEDPLYQGDRGDVSNFVRSRGLCVGDCDPSVAPTEINLGDSWALLKEQMYAPPVQPVPTPTPVIPPPTDPVIEQPPVTPPTGEPDPIAPHDPEPIDVPVVNVPDETVDLPTDIEITYNPDPYFIDLVNWGNFGGTIDIVSYPFLQIPDWQLIHVSNVFDPLQFSVYDAKNLSLRNGQLYLYNADSTSLASYNFAVGTTNPDVGATVPEPHSLLMASLLCAGISLFRNRAAR